MRILKPFLVMVGVVVGGVGALVFALALLTWSPTDRCLDDGGMMQDGKCIGARNSKTGD
jgi:hypothetical protein